MLKKDGLMNTTQKYCPPFYLENGLVQTFLASAKLRATGKNKMAESARETIIHTTEGIRLLGYLSAHPDKSGKGLVILLHGWEGSSDSTYILTTGRYLFQRGYDVFRLNFRDHGKSHHLNKGIFYAILIEEVFDAVCRIARDHEDKPVFVMGFSLGGNFALRIAKRCLLDPIDNLEHVVAVSPVLDPCKATDKIDESIFIRRYFLRKWRRSLKIKQSLYPDEYDFSKIIGISSIRHMTEKLLEHYSSYGSVDDYFKGYSLLGGDLKDVKVPATLIAAKDDPIIPIDDFFRLKVSPSTHLMIQDHGGHNGFVNGTKFSGWYEKVVDHIFTRYLQG